MMIGIKQGILGPALDNSDLGKLCKMESCLNTVSLIF